MVEPLCPGVQTGSGAHPGGRCLVLIGAERPAVTQLCIMCHRLCPAGRHLLPSVVPGVCFRGL